MFADGIQTLNNLQTVLLAGNLIRRCVHKWKKHCTWLNLTSIYTRTNYNVLRLSNHENNEINKKSKPQIQFISSCAASMLYDVCQRSKTWQNWGFTTQSAIWVTQFVQSPPIKRNWLESCPELSFLTVKLVPPHCITQIKFQDKLLDTVLIALSEHHNIWSIHVL